MSYATVEQLAATLHITGTAAIDKNRASLQSALDASQLEIDHWVDRVGGGPLPDPPPELAVQVNIARAVEHWKASDAAFGGVGLVDTGILTVREDTFARHAAILIPLVEQFGIA